jgi:excisionase family DNA binding protein
MSAKKSTLVQCSSLSAEPLLLDIRGAAHALSSTVWTFRSLLWKKEIPFIRIGRRFLIDPADIREFIQRKKEEAA